MEQKIITVEEASILLSTTPFTDGDIIKIKSDTLYELIKDFLKDNFE